MDIEMLCTTLCTALGKHDLAAARDKAHAIKGIGLSVGAVQLCAVATRLTHIGQAELEHDNALITEISTASARTISALRSIVQSGSG
ncbi:MAG: Hpt domain-containing protein [Noviherbaspirillum sp.]